MFLFVAFFSLIACGSEDWREAHYNGYAQGTSFHLSFLHQGPEPEGVGEAVDSILKAVDRSMSTYQPNSLISRLNRGDTLALDPDFVRVWRASQEVYTKTNGVFDPSIGKLVRLWGFGPDGKGSVDSAKVDSLRNYVGLAKIKAAPEHFSLPFGMELDFNAIAQGYTVDLLAEYFESIGVVNYMLELGGEVRCLGENFKGKAWRIGVDKPTEEIDQQDRFQFIIGMDSLALATSGNYRKFWVDSLSGQRYAHTLSPKTGYPVKNRLLSASVLARDGMTADAYATAFMAMGLSKTKEFLQAHPELGLEVYLIYGVQNDWEVYQSEGFKQRILNL